MIRRKRRSKFPAGSPASSAAEKRHWVRLTRVCNQRCLFCHDRVVQDGSSVPLEAVKDDLERGRREGLRRVVLSGGEPTLHPGFLKIVRLARALGYGHVQAVTNGRRFCYPGFLAEAVKAGVGELTFSLHGHNAALHDRLTRAPGSFVQALAALKAALAAPGLIVSVDVVINRLNLPELREVLEFFIGRGVREFDLLALVPFGDAWEHRGELFCDWTVPENLASLHRALELARRPDLHIWTNRLRPEFLEGFESLIQPPDKILDEVRGRREMLEPYIKGGPPPACLGDACPQCFMRDFCADLAALLRNGVLPARVGHLCRGLPEPVLGFRLGPRPDVVAYAEFFIRARYFVKPSACRGCALAPACDGISVREARASGFGVLAPVESLDADAGRR